MCCNIFHLFVGRNKKRKLVIEANCRLNINIEERIANLCCLFRYFKNMGSFFLLLISLYKNIFLHSCSWTEKDLVLLRKRRWFRWWHIPSCLIKFLWYHDELYFPAVAMWHVRSTVMTMKAPVPWEDEVFLRQFLNLTFIYKKFIIEKYYQKPISTYLDSGT